MKFSEYLEEGIGGISYQNKKEEIRKILKKHGVKIVKEGEKHFHVDTDVKTFKKVNKEIDKLGK